nr:hypothetical protein CFP56_22344 [Quercus suber]
MTDLSHLPSRYASASVEAARHIHMRRCKGATNGKAYLDGLNLCPASILRAISAIQHAYSLLRRTPRRLAVQLAQPSLLVIRLLSTLRRNYTIAMVLRGHREDRRSRRHSSPSHLDDHLPCAKRHKACRYPPEVWDRLSKIKLTRKALEEFDRRTVSIIDATADGSRRGARNTSAPLLRSTARRIKEHASRGGPDLGRLRGVSTHMQNNIGFADCSSL